MTGIQVIYAYLTGYPIIYVGNLLVEYIWPGKSQPLLEGRNEPGLILIMLIWPLAISLGIIWGICWAIHYVFTFLGQKDDKLRKRIGEAKTKKDMSNREQDLLEQIKVLETQLERK